jgi:hypothetical protein
VAKQADGSYTAAGATGSTSTGNATLSSSNYNALSWGAVSNAASYDIYRVTGGATQGKIANVTTLSVNDTGLPGDGTTAPITNTTSSLTANGPAIFNGPFQVRNNPFPLTGHGVELAYADSIPAGFLQAYNRDTSAWLNLQINALSLSFQANGTVALTISSAGLTTFATPASIAFGSNWISYTPTITPGGSMTVSSLVINDAQYMRIGPFVFIKLYIALTAGGTANNQIAFSLPIAQVGAQSLMSAAIQFATWSPAFGWIPTGGSVVNVWPSGGANYTLGVVLIMVEGFYRCA